MPKYEYENPNVFQVDSAAADAQRGPISIRCPHCRHQGIFQVVRSCAVAFQKRIAGNMATECSASIRICPGQDCMGLVFVIEGQGEIAEIEPPELLDFDPEGLPRRCEATLKEAVACHGAEAYRAAAMMVRRLLEEICEENGAEGDNLHQRLKALRAQIVLPEALFDAMDELKALGNDAAHVEAKAFDNIDRAEAADSIELAKEILKSLYQLKGLLDRLQARKKSGAKVAVPTE